MLLTVLRNETPKWYLSVGQEEKAIEQIDLYLKEGDAREICEQTKKEITKKTQKITFKETACSNPLYVRSTWIAMGITLFSDMIGLTTIGIYANEVFEDMYDIKDSPFTPR